MTWIGPPESEQWRLLVQSNEMKRLLYSPPWQVSLPPSKTPAQMLLSLRTKLDSSSAREQMLLSRMFSWTFNNSSELDPLNSVNPQPVATTVDCPVEPWPQRQAGRTSFVISTGRDNLTSAMSCCRDLFVYPSCLMNSAIGMSIPLSPSLALRMFWSPSRANVCFL